MKLGLLPELQSLPVSITNTGAMELSLLTCPSVAAGMEGREGRRRRRSSCATSSRIALCIDRR